MASVAIVTAVETYLADQWNVCPVVGGLSTDDRPDNAAAFLAVQYPVANSSQLTIGAPGQNVWRTEGAFRILIHTKKADRSLALAWADELASIFRGKDLGGVLTFAPSPPAIDDRNEEGLYFRLSFAVPYQHDIIG